MPALRFLRRVPLFAIIAVMLLYPWSAPAAVLPLLVALAPAAVWFTARFQSQPEVIFAAVFVLAMPLQIATGIWAVTICNLVAGTFVIWYLWARVLPALAIRRLPLRHALWMLIFVAWGLVAALFSLNIEVSFPIALRFFGVALGVTLLFDLFRDERRMQRFNNVLFGGLIFWAAIICILTTWQTATGDISTALFVKKDLFGVNTNAAAEPLLFATPLAMAYLLEARCSRRIGMATISLLGLALLLSLSRSAWLGAFVGAGAVFCIHQILNGHRRRIVIFALVGTVGALGVLWWAQNTISSWSSLLSRGTTGRTYLWQAAWEMFRSHPWTGIGPGMWRIMDVSYAAYDGPIEISHFVSHPHNTWFRYAAEMGIPGVGLLAAWIGLLLRDAWFALTHRDRGSLSAPANAHLLGSVGILFAFLGRSLFESDALIDTGWPMTSLWIMITAASLMHYATTTSASLTAADR
jgi:O-antigen ligase